MNITVDKKDAVLAAAIDAERYPAFIITPG